MNRLRLLLAIVLASFALSILLAVFVLLQEADRMDEAKQLLEETQRRNWQVRDESTRRDIQKVRDEVGGRP